MTAEQKEWIPIYGLFVVPDSALRNVGRAVLMGFYHGSWITMVILKGICLFLLL